MPHEAKAKKSKSKTEADIEARIEALKAEVAEPKVQTPVQRVITLPSPQEQALRGWEAKQEEKVVGQGRAARRDFFFKIAKANPLPEPPKALLESAEKDVLARLFDPTIDLTDRVPEHTETTAVAPKSAETASARGRGRPPSQYVAMRREIICGVTKKGLEGEAYCRELARRLPTPMEWQKQKLHACPTSYLDAWNHPDANKRDHFRRLISDEKSRLTRDLRNKR